MSDIYLFRLAGQSSAMAEKKVLLLESGAISAPAVSTEQPYSNRVCALSMGSVKFLERTYVYMQICGMTLILHRDLCLEQYNEHKS